MVILKLYHQFKKLLSPKYCLICLDKVNYYICPKCINNLNFKINFYCLECGKRVNKKCNISNHSKLIKALISFGEYENQKLKELVIYGKENAYEIFNDLGFYISKELKKFNFKDYVLVPIPLTRRKLLQRGFNQTEILAKKISEETGLKISKCLIKIKETKDQASLSYEERLKNLNNAFKVIGNVPEKIILIDDVKTTGTTLKESAKVLKEAGAKEIYALTILK